MRPSDDIDLPREGLDAQIWATDLWVSATDNLQRIEEAGVADRVFPVHAEAHDLPYADGFFDVIVSVDAYQYFGTDDLYLSYLSRFLRPAGRIGIVVPAAFAEPGFTVPEELAPYWEPDFCCFHSPDWWRTHWDKTGLVDIEIADALPHGWEDWLRWEEAIAPFQTGWKKEAGEREIELLRRDRGSLLGFTRMVARKA